MNKQEEREAPAADACRPYLKKQTQALKVVSNPSEATNEVCYFRGQLRTKAFSALRNQGHLLPQSGASRFTSMQQNRISSLTPRNQGEKSTTEPDVVVRVRSRIVQVSREQAVVRRVVPVAAA